MNTDTQTIYLVIDRDRLAITHTAAILKGTAIDRAVAFLGASWADAGSMTANPAATANAATRVSMTTSRRRG